LPGRVLSEVGGCIYGINEAGDAVGQLNGHAAMWKEGQAIDINSYLDGVEAGLTLHTAWDINDAGKIVTWGVFDGSTDPRLFLIAPGSTADCNNNGILDTYDIFTGNSPDDNADGIPDDCGGYAGVPPNPPPGGGVPGVSVKLGKPSPNPMMGRTEISFALDRRRHVALDIYDVTGRRVVCLAEGHLEGGQHRIAWTGLDEGGRKVSPGIYFLRMESEGFTASKKMIVMQ
jgi:hypothetical protein